MRDSMTVDPIGALVNGGDWACAHADENGLATVCEELAALVDPRLSKRAAQIAGLVFADMAEATGAWSELSRMLRGEGGWMTERGVGSRLAISDPEGSPRV